MAHEITSNDGVVLTGKRAWHGLGTIVEDAPTPSDALRIAGLDWEVEREPVFLAGESDPIPNVFANVRSDTREVFTTVSDRYELIQNRELAAFAEALAEQGDVVKCETAGSIRGGRKVWFLLRGESFAVRSEDEVRPYICVSNSHDGSNALRCTPTTVRVVCSNTLHLVVPQADGMSRAKPEAFVARHSGNIADKVEEAKAALGLYNKGLAATRDRIDYLAGESIDADALRKFFLNAYAATFEPIPADPKTKSQERVVKKAQAAWIDVERRFENELRVAGATKWNAFNSFTGWVQHRKRRGANDAARAENAIGANLFGVDAERTNKAFELALAG